MASLMKCGFPDWPTCQTYFAISASLTRAYRVSMLHHFQYMTKQKLSEKLASIIKEAESRQLSNFPLLVSFISENEIQLNPELVANIKKQCENLIAGFKEYFPENLTSEFWIRDAFSVEDILPKVATTNEKDELIEFSCDVSLQKNVQEVGFDRVLVGRTKGVTAQF
jgi:hypothetical protein